MYVYACMFIGIYMYINTHMPEYFSLAFFVTVKMLILKVTLEITFSIIASLAIYLNFYHLHSTHHWLFHILFISLFFFLTLTTDYFAIYFTCFLLFFFIVLPCRAMLLEGRDVLFNSVAQLPGRYLAHNKDSINSFLTGILNKLLEKLMD